MLLAGCGDEDSPPNEIATAGESTSAASTSTGVATSGLASSENTSETGLGGTDDTAEMLRLRVAVLTVDLEGVDVCVVGPEGDVGPLGEMLEVGSLDYPVATGYLDVPLSTVESVRLIDAGEDCTATPRVVVPVESRGTAAYQTLVLFGDATASRLSVTAVLFPDETDAPPEAGAKARNIHADPEAPTIDVALISPAGPVFVFQDVSYQQTALASDLGSVSERGYVEGIPSVEFPIRVWQAGVRDPLLQIDDVPPFEPGGVYSVFPAGKVFSGQAEVFVCRDEPAVATPQDPWSACFLADATVLSDPE